MPATSPGTTNGNGNTITYTYNTTNTVEPGKQSPGQHYTYIRRRREHTQQLPV